MRLRDVDVGRWVRIKYDDIGVRDGIVIAKDHPSDPSPRMCKVFTLFDELDTSVQADQIVAVGNYVAAEDTGL